MASHSYKWHYGRIHYQRRGLGDPLLLVHNVYPGASWQEWEHNFDALSRHFTVYAMDLLGFGQSDAPSLTYRAAHYVEQVFDFLREVVGQPALVAAAGLSCAYVSEVAAWRENLFRRLVFICPRSEPTGLDSPRWLAAIRRFLMSNRTLGSGYYETMAGETEIEIYLRSCFHHPKCVTRDKIAQLVANCRRPGSIHPYASLITGYLDSYILDTLPRVKLPLLLIWGKQARPTPVEHSVRLVALARQCRLEVIDQAGSWPHDEQSVRVNRLITEFAAAELPPVPDGLLPRTAAAQSSMPK
jgi:pimeloyl-ACP methyl ester carboxylesterase